MNTTLIPMNTAQVGNALTDLGTWIGAYFPALMGLGFWIAGLAISVLVAKGLLNLVLWGVEKLTLKRDLARFDKGTMSEDEFLERHYRG